MTPQTVLITGGAGFIGSHTALELLKAGHRVRLLDALLAPVHEGGAPPSWLVDDAELMVGDVRSRGDVERAMDGVDAVIHLAAYQDYLPDFSTFYSVNTVGTAMLYEVAVARGMELSKVVVASSQATYGEGTYRCAEDGTQMPAPRAYAQLEAGRWDVGCPVCGGGLALETTTEVAVNPHNSYATSKYTQELVAFNLGTRYGIPTTCLRYSIVQGPWQSFRNAYSGICRIFTLRVLAGKRPVAFEDGLQVRDYVWVGDVARANRLALEDERTDGEVYNVAGEDPVTVLRYGELVATTLGRPDLGAETRRLFRFGDTRHVVSSGAKLQALGWRPTTGLSDIIRGYAAWVDTQPGAQDHSEASLEHMLKVGTVRRAQA